MPVARGERLANCQARHDDAGAVERPLRRLLVAAALGGDQRGGEAADVLRMEDVFSHRARDARPDRVRDGPHFGARVGAGGERRRDAGDKARERRLVRGGGGGGEVGGPGARGRVACRERGLDKAEADGQRGDGDVAALSEKIPVGRGGVGSGGGGEARAEDRF